MINRTKPDIYKDMSTAAILRIYMFIALSPSMQSMRSASWDYSCDIAMTISHCIVMTTDVYISWLLIGIPCVGTQTMCYYEPGTLSVHGQGNDKSHDKNVLRTRVTGGFSVQQLRISNKTVL